MRCSRSPPGTRPTPVSPNVHFLEGVIERIPLPAESVDVVESVYASNARSEASGSPSTR